MNITGLLLIILGGLGFASQFLMVLGGDMHRAVSGFALFGGFLVLGVLARQYSKLKYKGGAPSIIGAILLFFGAVSIIFRLEEYGVGQLMETWGGMLFSVLCIAGGIALLRSGHKSHLLTQAK